MSKYLKSLIATCLVVCAAVCIGIFAAACSNEGKIPESVSITVLLDDDTPAVGAYVGICVVQNDGTVGACLTPVTTDENGVATLAIDAADGKNYEVHVTPPATYAAEYAYVDADGNPYGSNHGMHIDVTKTSSVTVNLVNTDLTVTDNLGETQTQNEYTFKSADDKLLLNVDVTVDEDEVGAWYQLTSYTTFNLAGGGFNLTDACDTVLIYLSPNDKLAVSLAEPDDLTFGDDGYTLTLGLTALEDADGSELHPLPASIGFGLVLDLRTNQTVYVSNETSYYMRDDYALDVTGTNFKANYDNVNYTEAFTVKATELDYNTWTTIPEVFTVGTADGTKGIVTLYISEHVFPGSESSPDVAELGKTVEFEYDGANAYWITFTASEAGSYTVAYSDDSYITDGGHNNFDTVESEEAGSFTVELEADQTLYIVVESYSMDPASLTITVTKTEA